MPPPGDAIEDVLQHLTDSKFPWQPGDRVMHAKRSKTRLSLQDVAIVFLLHFHGIGRDAFEAIRGMEYFVEHYVFVCFKMHLSRQVC